MAEILPKMAVNNKQ